MRNLTKVVGVPTGLFSLFVQSRGHHQRLITGLEVRDGGLLGPLRIDLRPVASGEKPQLELAGIGAAMRVSNDAMYVATVFPGGGASRAGLLVGDRVLAIGGVPVVDIGFDGAIQRIRGPEGTRVTLTLRRDDRQFDIEIPRLRIQVPGH